MLKSIFWIASDGLLSWLLEGDQARLPAPKVYQNRKRHPSVCYLQGWDNFSGET